MSGKVSVERIDELMNEASEKLVRTKYFAAERLANEALQAARQIDDFERMARIVMPLQEARRQRMLQAYGTGKVFVMTEIEDAPKKPKPGCYLFQPPLVGADARRMRLLGLESEVPLVALAREPITQLRQQPIVLISPGNTIRTKVDLPEDVEEPEIEWFVRAMEELGDWAIASLDPQMEVTRRIDAIMGRLDAVGEHEGLHQALVAACEEAARQPDDNAKASKNGGAASRSRAKAEL